jgi:hypothetical protein
VSEIALNTEISATEETADLDNLGHKAAELRGLLVVLSY